VPGNGGESAGSRHLAMFPLESVLFPGAILPLHVFEPRYRRMMADCLDGDRTFGVVLISRGSEVGGGDQRVGLGTEARIEDASLFPDGRWAVIAVGTRRIAVESWLPAEPYPLAVVRTVRETPVAVAADAVEAAATAVRRAWALLSELGQVRAPDETPPGKTAPGDPEAAIWTWCAASPLGPLDRQRLLEIDDLAHRAAALTELSLSVADDVHRLLGGSA
jgi:uncharacterized protein